MRMGMGKANCKWEWLLGEGGEGAGGEVAGGGGGAEARLAGRLLLLP